MTFRGPYADGPSAEDLKVDSPRLDRLAFKDPVRLVVVLVTLLASALTGLLKSRKKGWRVAASEGLIDGFEKLGPTYVKLGQLIASSPGLFPKPLADAALRCLDEVKPVSGAEARKVIAGDLGLQPEEIFKEFDDQPLSAASIAQVHACVLPDGREAVVKVQRPGIHAQMATDLRVAYFFAKNLERLSKFLKRTNPTAVLEDLHTVTFQELNSALEAHRQDRYRKNIHAFGDNEGVTVPEVYWDYCGPHVICMERMSGIPLDEFEEITGRGVDGPDLLQRGVKSWAEAVIIHGLFHGDVHAGNLWLLDDGRLCLLDFGIMGELEPEWQEFVKDVFYTGMIDMDFHRVVKNYRKLGIIPDGIGSDAEIAMRMELVFGPMIKGGVGAISLTKTLAMILDMAKSYEATTPKEMVLVTKQLAYFERYSKGLAPDWVLFSDITLARNIFPEEYAAKIKESA